MICSEAGPSDSGSDEAELQYISGFGDSETDSA